ncbi:MAG: glutamine-synthetase adenylyltransferase, partial [Rhodospirillales bacterium]|nr:glutamine-synthetase adenylyltransferase [Rhodospirillales bacterium]
MNHLDYSLETKGLPAPADLDLCARGHERWIEALHSTGDSDCQAFAQGTPENPSVSTLLDALFGNSPYLTQCAISNPKFILEVINQGPEWACADIQDRLTHLRSDLNADEVRVMCDLRQAKRDLSLAVAIADITNIWSVEQITHALSDFADKTLSCAASYALRKAADSGAITLAYEDDPERDSGYIILGMGKLGAGELNYSSDIDLIILFDPEVIQSEKPADLQRQFVRITRNLVKVMDERTADGYVFRTDLRLRPDPSATPIAVSVQAAEVYYESLGQNWERAAMIKARPVAGDVQAGAALID